MVSFHDCHPGNRLRRALCWADHGVSHAVGEMDPRVGCERCSGSSWLIKNCAIIYVCLRDSFRIPIKAGTVPGLLLLTPAVW